jgi:hypothetical protein
MRSLGSFAFLLESSCTCSLLCFQGELAAWLVVTTLILVR